MARRINPFEVEPEFTDEELRNIEIQEENDVINNAEYNLNLEQLKNNCYCGKCVPDWLGLGSNEEVVQELKKYTNWKDLRGGVICCRQVEEVVNFLNDTDDPTGPACCVTEDVDFKSMCQRKRALKATYRSYLHSRRRPPPVDFSNRTYRYTAYRTYSHLIYQKLGRGNRKAVPFCTLLDIRKHFPEDDANEYTSYTAGMEIERFRPNAN